MDKKEFQSLLRDKLSEQFSSGIMAGYKAFCTSWLDLFEKALSECDDVAQFKALSEEMVLFCKNGLCGVRKGDEAKQ